METSSRELVFLSAAPNDRYFVWQYRVLLSNFRKYDLSHKVEVLIFKHRNRDRGEDFQEEWDQLIKDYPEAKFFFYEDDKRDLITTIEKVGYIPLLRPWLLYKHFSKYPELSKKAVFYHDSDICWTKKPDFLDALLDDDICYLSDTRSYISAQYFDSKVKDVLPDKLEEYKTIDPLQEVLNPFNITREIAEKNQENSGGAQYLLKNIDAKFWEDVFKGCIYVRNSMSLLNRRYFENEDKGFQVWAADMWSVLWNLWARGLQTKCPPEMDFAWATDNISKWDRVYLYHDAGASTRPIKEGHLLFHKREHKYINNQASPLDEDLSFVSEEYCSKNYVKEIENARVTEWRTYEYNEFLKEENEKMKTAMMWGTGKPEWANRCSINHNPTDEALQAIELISQTLK